MRFFSFAMKIWLTISLLAIGMSSLSVYYFYVNSYDLVLEQLGKRLRDSVQMGSLVFDSPAQLAIQQLQHGFAEDELRLTDDDLRSLSPDPDTALSTLEPEVAKRYLNSPDYHLLQARLQILQQRASRYVQSITKNYILPDVHLLKIYLPIAQSPEFNYARLLISSTTPTNQDFAKVFELRAEQTIVRKAFHGKPVYNIDTKQDTHQYMIKTAVPIFGDEDEVLAVLEMDLVVDQGVADLKALGWHARLIYLVAIAASILFAFLLSRWLGQPLRELGDAVERVRRHDFSAQVQVHSQDELGRLASAFNFMIQDLHTYAHSLETKHQALQHLDEIKDEFIISTSQELNKPLQDIVDLSASLIEGAAGTQSASTRANLGLISSTALSLQSQVLDLMDFACLRHHSLSLQRKPISLREIADLVLNTNRPLVGYKPIQLINAIPQDAPLVQADEKRLQQILHNLVNNAIKFTESGRVTVQLGNVDADFIEIQICDTGIGISTEHQEKIFDALFEQIEEGIQPLQPLSRMNLGLAICKQLVRLHGGDISVQSRSGQGSQFCFTLPRSQETEPQNIRYKQGFPFPVESNLPEQQASDSDKQTIMVVDDDIIGRQVLVNQLSLEGYAIEQAASGIEALELLSQGRVPDLILLDVMMPRMTGYDVTRKVRETWEINELPILLLTSRDHTTDRLQGLDAGANDFLVKPIEREELKARIKAHLRIRRLETALMRTRDEALAANLDKSRFIANMNHELRTPLNAIIGYGDLLLDPGNLLSETETREALKDIHSSALSLLSVINDILTMASLEAGTIIVSPVRFQIHNLLQSIIADNSTLASQNHNEIIFECEEALPSLFTDQEKLQQVLGNLINNALKFTQHGQIHISCARFESDDHKDWLRIQVSDNGPGIASQYQSRLFQAFTQFDESSSRQYGGTGLGLAISQGFIELLHGTLALESELGKGSCFTVCVPARLDSKI